MGVILLAPFTGIMEKIMIKLVPSKRETPRHAKETMKVA